jgi:hypothetical protein
MTRTCAWIVMLAFAVALAAPALAQQSSTTTTAPSSSAPATSAPAKPAEPAKKDATAAKPKTATGTVKTASADNVVVVVGKDKKEMTFALDKDTKVTKAGKAATAADIAADDSATVSYTEKEGKMTAKSVSVKAKTAAAKPKS